MDVQKPGAVDSRIPSIARWRSAVAGVLAKSTRRDPADLPAEPERLLDSPTYEGFPIRPLYTSLDALPEPPLPGRWPYVRGGDALRDVKSGWKVAEAFPASGTAACRRQRRGAGRLDRGRQRAGAARRRPEGVAPAELDRLLEGVFLDLVPVVLDAGADYVAAAEAVLALLTDLDDDQRSPAVGGSRRRPVDRAAERATGAERRRRRRDRREGDADTTAACARSPSTGPHSTISAPARRGNWPAAVAAAVALSAAARRGWAQRVGCVAADQFPASPPTTTSS